MSLVRYSADDSRSVVLRHQQTLVLYDPHSQQIILREASPTTPLDAPSPPACPYCKRPLHDDDHDEVPAAGPNTMPRPRSSTPLAESGFVDRDYFRMLERSLHLGESEEARRTIPPLGRPVPRLKPEDTLETEDGSVSEDEHHPQVHANGTNSHGINSAAFSPGYFERFFITEKELGKGGKGVVLLVKHSLDGVSLGHFACKRVPVGDNHDWLEKVLLEVQLLQRLAHQNLVSYRHVWLENVQISNFGPKVPCAFILQQYCNSGDLHNYVLKPTKMSTKEQLKERLRRHSRGQLDPVRNLNEPRKLPFDQIISFFRDIASGLNFLHSHGFIHRDLKPSNCLLNADIPGKGLSCLVSDFGEVQQVNQIRNSTGATGTISYCAPEVLRRITPDGNYGNFTTKSDIFSLGMILHFMCFGRLPYLKADLMHEENEDIDALRLEITAWAGMNDASKSRADLPERLYQSLKTLINPDPSLRPSAEDILLGIELGIGEDAPLRRGSGPGNAGRQPSVAEELSQAISFRRISPVADTPPPSTPRNASSTHLSALPTSDRKSSRLSQNLTFPPDTPEEPLLMRHHHQPHTAHRRILTGHMGDWWTLVFKMLVFLVKVAYMTQPCLPRAVRGWVYYPLLLVAAGDFVNETWGWTLGLGLVHFGVVAGTYAGDWLCLA